MQLYRLAARDLHIVEMQTTALEILMNKIAASLIALVMDLFGWDDSEPSMGIVIHEVMAPVWRNFLSEVLGEEYHPDINPLGVWSFGDDVAHESLYLRGYVLVYLQMNKTRVGTFVADLAKETGKSTLVTNCLDGNKEKQLEQYLSDMGRDRCYIWDDARIPWWDMPVCPKCGRAVSLMSDGTCFDCHQSEFDF